MENKPAIGLIELPELGLLDPDGQNMLSEESEGFVLISKQILMANLEAAGFNTHLYNLKNGDTVYEYGKASWGGKELTKVSVGGSIHNIDPTENDAWGVTNNFSQYREIACIAIEHLASRGKPVVIGGSDVAAEPKPYLDAGATAVILDKTGAANAPTLDYVLGKTPRQELSGVILANGAQQPPREVRSPMRPQQWALPEQSVVEQCLGTRYKGLPFPEDNPKVGSVFTDIGCDQKCDFCQTPTYSIGYRAMTPDRALEWFATQKQAGARFILNNADQFLGRVLKKGGREEVLEIMQGVRDMGLSVIWGNGLELKKATMGHGIKQSTDFAPDEELINALWGWDGHAGCYFGYLPAERPLLGRENYRKLLPWQEHCEVVKAVARTGTPYLRYGVIIGLAEDDLETFQYLEEALWGLFEELEKINPEVNFQIAPFAISPIPGTLQGLNLRKSGLVRFEDPSIFGSVWTPAVDTHHLSYEEVAQWQVRLSGIGRKFMNDGSTREATT